MPDTKEPVQLDIEDAIAAQGPIIRGVPGLERAFEGLTPPVATPTEPTKVDEANG